MTTSSRSQRYFTGLAFAYGSSIISILISFWLAPFTLQFISREAYGIFSLANTLVLWLGFVQLGIPNAANLKLAHASGNNDQELANQTVSTTLFVQIFLTAGLVLVGLIISNWVPDFFEISPGLEQQAILATYIILSAFALRQTQVVFSITLFAYQHIAADHAINLLTFITRTVFTVIFLIMGFELLSLAFAQIIAQLVTIVVGRVWVAIALPDIEFRLKHFRWEVLRSALSIGLWSNFGGIALIVIQSTDQAVVGRLVSVEAITVYAFTASMYLRSVQFLNQIVNSARPALGQLMGSGKVEDALKTYRQIFALSTGLAVIMLTSIWAGNAAFVRAWVGAENYGGDILSLALALNMITNVWTLANRATLAANLRVASLTMFIVAEAVLNIGLSIFLTLQIGIVGVALSTALASLLTTFFGLPYLTSRMFNRPFSEFLTQDFARQMRGIILLAPISFGMKFIADAIGGFLGAAVGAGTVALMGLLIMWFAVFTRPVKKRISGYVERASKRIIGRKIVLAR